MDGFDLRKIGNTTFMVFANGMVPVDDVAQLRLDPDGYCIALKTSGWVMMKPLPDRAAEPAERPNSE